MFEISTVAFIKNELLTIIVDFGIRSSFSKGQASAFLRKVLVWVRVHFVKYINQKLRHFWNSESFWITGLQLLHYTHRSPVDTGRQLNVHKTFRRRPGRPLNVLCTFNLRPVSTGRNQNKLKMMNWWWTDYLKKGNKTISKLQNTFHFAFDFKDNRKTKPFWL